MANWVLGLTGGIGSGKSVACHFFYEQGIDIIDADICAREVVEPGTISLLAIRERYGPVILLDNGRLNRSLLREKIFSNINERKWLEDLMHPHIHQCIQEHLKQSNTAYSILVSPLLFETSQSKLCQRILLIDAPEELQLSRTKTRDSCSTETIKSIISSQWPRNEKLKHADDTVLNSGSIPELYHSLALLHNEYLNKSNTWSNNCH